MFDWLFAFGLALLAQTSLAHDHALSERPRPTGVAQCEAWPTSPALPDLVEDSLPSLMTMEYRTVYDWDGGRDVAFLGVGHLVPDDEHSWDWSPGAIIPLYDGTDGQQVGWINRGWIQRGSSRRPLTFAGMVETEYERATLLVLEQRPDGWFRFRYDMPTDTGDGTAWSHPCLLGLGDTKFTVELWKDLFLTFSEEESPLSYRSRVRHALRAGPSADSESIAWIGADDEVEAIEIQGEWMRVTVFQPGKFLTMCIGDQDWNGSSQTGWIRWWDPEKGPWLWYPTRGC